LNNSFQYFSITLNDDALKNASMEYVAATILHETLHAYFRAEQGNTLEIADHEEMSKKYIEPMAKMLNLTYLMPLDEARALAWGGLGDTQAWKTMIANDIKNGTGITQNIVNINNRYKNLNNQYGARTQCRI
jgi:hypothetical protein